MIWVSTAISFLLGIVAESMFPKLPAKWLCDYNELPSEMHKPENRKLSFKAALLCGVICGIAMFTFMHFMSGLDWIIYASFGLIVPTLLVVAICDMRFGIIPNELLILSSILGIPVAFRNGYLPPVLGTLIGGGLIFAILFIASKLFKKEAMGFGDVLLSALCGYLCGVEGYVVVIFTAVIIAAIVFTILLIFKKIDKDTPQPFGPFLVAGVALALCFFPFWQTLLQTYLYY